MQRSAISPDAGTPHISLLQHAAKDVRRHLEAWSLILLMKKCFRCFNTLMQVKKVYPLHRPEDGEHAIKEREEMRPSSQTATGAPQKNTSYGSESTALYKAYFFGPFRIIPRNQPINEFAWRRNKARSLLK